MKVTNRQKQAMEMRVRIQQAAFRLFAQSGFENISMEEIAREAGCSVGNIYHYFPNKDSLTVGMTDRVDLQYCELERLYDTLDLSPAENLIRFSGDALVIDSGEDLLFQCFIHSLRYPEQGVLKPDLGKVYFGFLRRLVEAFCESTLIREEFTTEDVFQSFVIMNRGILMEWRIEEGGFDIRERGCNMAAALIRGFSGNSR